MLLENLSQKDAEVGNKWENESQWVTGHRTVGIITVYQLHNWCLSDLYFM